jgi:hypothetical protein
MTLTQKIMKYLFGFVMMLVGAQGFAQTWTTTHSTANIGMHRYETPDGSGLNYSIRTQAGGGWSWQLTDNTPVAYFTVDFPTGMTAVNNPNTTYNSYTMMKLRGPDYANGHGLNLYFFGSNNIDSDLAWSYGGGGGGAAVVNVQNKPLAFGTNNMGRMIIMGNGNVGIGTFNPGSYKLAVEGKIGAREINVTTAIWSDYVFSEDYKLPSLESLEAYIAKNHHLPEVPGEKEVINDGIDLGEMNVVLLKKIEELTLYVIEQNKLIKSQQERLEKLEESVKR